MPLVLSRSREEKVVITVPPSDTPTRITVTVGEHCGGKTRLVFDAPVAVLVNRGEIQSAIDRDEASKATGG